LELLSQIIFFIDHLIEFGKRPGGCMVLCDLFAYIGELLNKRGFLEGFKAEILRGKARKR
jgi:hypothetical protein